MKRAPNLHDLAWPASAYRTADGWVGITSGRVEETRRLLELLGLDRLLPAGARTFEDIVDDAATLDITLVQAISTWATDELVSSGQTAGLAVAPARWPGDLMSDEQLLARGFVHHSDGQASMAYPATLNGHRPEPPAPAKFISSFADRTATQEHATTTGTARPLAGIRVVDLTWALAGPFATMVLADLGADVVKIESEHHIDASRLVGPYSGAHDIDHSEYHRFFNREKRSIHCDLANKRDVNGFLELVTGSNLVVENFRSRALDAKRLGFNDLRRMRPSLAMCSISGFGRSGPRAGWRSYGAGMAETHSGLAAATGGDRPIVPGRSYADCIAGLSAALTMCAQLYYQGRRDRSSYSDVAQFETCAATVDELALFGPDPAESHRIDGSDTDGWWVEGVAGRWPLLGPADVARRSLETGFCSEYRRLDGDVDTYSLFPGFLDGGRLAITRPGPLLGEHRIEDILTEWEVAQGQGLAGLPAATSDPCSRRS